MQGRGNSKRHTVATTDEVHSMQQNQQVQHMGGNSNNSGSGTPTGMRTRRTGLLTVKEKPPGKALNT